MIERPVYLSISEDAQFGGLLKGLIKFGTFGVVDLKKKKAPYDPNAVATAVADSIKAEQAAIPQMPVNTKYLLAGGAGLALLLLLKGGRRRGR